MFCLKLKPKDFQNMSILYELDLRITNVHFVKVFLIHFLLLYYKNVQRFSLSICINTLIYLNFANTVLVFI